MQHPLKPFNNYNNNVGKFLDNEYFKLIGSEHPGADLNANTGGNTDLGHKVYSITKGIVVTAKHYPTWGNIVLIHHPSAAVWSQYAHLDNMTVKAGDAIEEGACIGTVGRGDNNRYLAHLHFEIRYKLLPADYWPSTHFKNRYECQQFIKAHYVDPITYLRKMI